MYLKMHVTETDTTLEIKHNIHFNVNDKCSLQK